MDCDQDGVLSADDCDDNDPLEIDLCLDVGGGQSFTAMYIPSGIFTMGCTSEQGNDCFSHESPAHQVTLSTDFYMMKSELTQGVYQQIMGNNSSYHSGSNRPVENVSWYDAVEFANALSVQQGLVECYNISGNSVNWSNPDCTGWRLPTEAEWEYAARGGESYKYPGSNTVGDVAWYSSNSSGQTQDVCLKQENGYGLCDMSGNVWEWVWDWYNSEYYSSSPTVDPQGPTSGSYRVRRGGSWSRSARYVRVSNRSYDGPSSALVNLGFRLCRLSP